MKKQRAKRVTRALKGILRARSGQAMVEMAICLPLLLLLVFGIMDFGWLFYNQMSVENASREGARYAIVNHADPGVMQGVKDVAEAMMAGPGDADVTLSVSGNDATVKVVKRVQVLTPLAGIFVNGQTVELKSSTTMRQDS